MKSNTYKVRCSKAGHYKLCEDCEHSHIHTLIKETDWQNKEYRCTTWCICDGDSGKETTKVRCTKVKNQT